MQIKIESDDDWQNFIRFDLILLNPRKVSKLLLIRKERNEETGRRTEEWNLRVVRFEFCWSKEDRSILRRCRDKERISVIFPFYWPSVRVVHWFSWISRRWVLINDERAFTMGLHKLIATHVHARTRGNSILCFVFVLLPLLANVGLFSSRCNLIKKSSWYCNLSFS